MRCGGELLDVHGSDSPSSIGRPVRTVDDTIITYDVIHYRKDEAWRPAT